MKNTAINIVKFLPITIPFIIILSLILLIKSSFFTQNPQVLSNAITIDLLVIVPLLYFFIIRKREVPKITVITMFVLGVVLLSIFLPKENQSLLNGVKTYFIPLLELGVISFLIYKVIQLSKAYKKEKKSQDFYTTLKEATLQVLPKKVAVILVTEISVVYYGFLNWKKKPLQNNEFSYHKKGTVISIIVGFLMVICIETFALHFLLLKWSIVAAWILTGLSIYTALQFFALARSISKRPITIHQGELNICFGFFSDWRVSIEEIKEIEFSTKDLSEDKSIVAFSPLGSLTENNIILHFHKEQEFSGVYGMKRKAKSIALFVDEKEKFKRLLEESF